MFRVSYKKKVAVFNVEMRAFRRTADLFHPLVNTASDHLTAAWPVQ